MRRLHDVGDHRVARRLEQRPPEGALDRNQQGDLPDGLHEGEADEPHDAHGQGEDEHLAAADTVGQTAAPELHRHHHERDQTEHHADHRHGRADVLVQIDTLEREGEGGGADVDEDAQREHPELAGIRA
jgi:hypothetical protein